MSAFVFLLHAHDHAWRNRRVSLRDRSAACDILWQTAIRVHIAGARP